MSLSLLLSAPTGEEARDRDPIIMNISPHCTICRGADRKKKTKNKIKKKTCGSKSLCRRVFFGVIVSEEPVRLPRKGCLGSFVHRKDFPLQQKGLLIYKYAFDHDALLLSSAGCHLTLPPPFRNNIHYRNCR